MEGIDPNLEKFADNILFSALSIAVSGLSAAAMIKYKSPYPGAFAISGGISAARTWKYSWRHWDSYKAGKAGINT